MIQKDFIFCSSEYEMKLIICLIFRVKDRFNYDLSFKLIIEYKNELTSDILS
jgi:hypothetical protein